MNFVDFKTRKQQNSVGTHTNSIEMLDKSDDILDNESAKIYHEGFSRQVQRWPVNPVTVLIKHVRKRVPRKHVIADLGCGDAKIASAVQNTVHSFDLIKHNER